MKTVYIERLKLFKNLNMVMLNNITEIDEAFTFEIRVKFLNCLKLKSFFYLWKIIIIRSFFIGR